MILEVCIVFGAADFCDGSGYRLSLSSLSKIAHTPDQAGASASCICLENCRFESRGIAISITVSFLLLFWGF